MRTNIGRVAVVKENYAPIIDVDENPLLRLPPTRRSQTTAYPSVMLTAIFRGAVGAWFWYGGLGIAHPLLAVAALITDLGFRAASRVAPYRDYQLKTYRDYPLKDGTARYDDVGGS